MNCSKCNAWVPDDSVFCPECGQKIEAPAPAPVENVAAEAPVATAAPEVTETAQAPAKAAPAFVEKAKEVLAKVTVKVPAKYLKIGVAAVALLLVVVIVASLFSAPKEFNYALFVRDGQVQYAEMPKGKDVIEITSDFAEDASNYELSAAAYYLSSFFHLTEDGKKMFYPDKVDSGYTLYYRDITNPKKEPVKLESNMEGAYQVNEKGNLVTYIKDGKLYQHNLKEKTKIASDVEFFVASADGKTLIYLVEDGDNFALYHKKGNKDATKIASDVSEFYYTDEKLSTVIYSKEDSLYTQKVGKDATKIASDVQDVLYAYESGEVYYTVSKDDELTYWDLMEDDYKDKDDYNYDYYAEWLKEEELGLSVSALCYYNGKESVTVTESMVDDLSYAVDTPVLVYQALDSEELPTFSLTDYINGDVDLWDELDEYLIENTMYFVAAEEATAKLDLEDIYDVSLSDNGKTVYARADYDSEEHLVNLYQITLNGAKVKKTEKLDEEVYASRLSVFSQDKDSHVVYFKEVDDEEGELYMDGKHIDDDVYLYYISYNFDTDDLYYTVDWDSDDEMGTLKYSNGKKSTTVKDDVHSFVFTPDGECLFLYDYSDSSYKGELWIQNGKKVQKLADDVVAIIPVY